MGFGFVSGEHHLYQHYNKAYRRDAENAEDFLYFILSALSASCGKKTVCESPCRMLIRHVVQMIDILQPADNPLFAKGHQDVEHAGAGQLTGEHGSHAVDQDTGLDVKFSC